MELSCVTWKVRRICQHLPEPVVPVTVLLDFYNHFASVIDDVYSTERTKDFHTGAKIARNCALHTSFVSFNVSVQLLNFCLLLFLELWSLNSHLIFKRSDRQQDAPCSSIDTTVSTLLGFQGLMLQPVPVAYEHSQTHRALSGPRHATGMTYSFLLGNASRSRGVFNAPR